MDDFDLFDPPLVSDSPSLQISTVRTVIVEPIEQQIPQPVVELEIPSTSADFDAQLIFDEPFQNDIEVPFPSYVAVETVGVSESIPSPETSSKTCATSSTRRRPYEPDPIRGTSEHQEKRARNNAAVRKSRAKATEAVQITEFENSRRERQLKHYTEASEKLKVLTEQFKRNLFTRSAEIQEEQQQICSEFMRINDELRQKGFVVPELSLDDTR